MEAFEADFKNAPFLPDAFKVRKKIEEMTGVYIPFWMFDCDCSAAITYGAQMVTSWSDSNYHYTKTDYYRLFRSGSVGFANIPVDGSKKQMTHKRRQTTFTIIMATVTVKIMTEYFFI